LYTNVKLALNVDTWLWKNGVSCADGVLRGNNSNKSKIRKRPRELQVGSCCDVVQSLPWSFENGLSCRSCKPGRRLVRSRRPASDVWLRARTNGPNWPRSVGSIASEWVHLGRRVATNVGAKKTPHCVVRCGSEAACAPQAARTRKSGSGVWTSAFSVEKRMPVKAVRFRHPFDLISPA